MVSTGITVTAAAADAAAAPPIEPYFVANGEATTRATSLPPLPGFETFGGANSATATPYSRWQRNLLQLLPRCRPDRRDHPDLSYHFSPQHRQLVELSIQLQHRQFVK